MSKRSYTFTTGILVLVGIVLLVELIRDIFKAGDFVGYVNAGNLVLAGDPIYSDFLNTWPPFFSVFSVVLALGGRLSSAGIRLIWLLGSLVALYYIVREAMRLSVGRTFSLRRQEGEIPLQEPLVVIPLLIMLRFIMENLANVQINIYLLLCATMGIVLFVREKYVWSGFLFALSISLKVYPIFFLLYFVYKRAWQQVLWILVFLVGINAISFFAFGFEQAIAYYQQWYTEIAPRSLIAHHKNQSLLGMLLRFLTVEDPGHELYVNFLDLKPDTVRRIWLGVVALAAVYPAFLFRKQLTDTGSIRSVLEYAFVFAAVPILSPLSWKPYFIFLWLPYLLIYVFLFRIETRIPQTSLRLLRAVYGISVLLNVGSTEALVGGYFSDVLEAYAALTVATVMVLAILVFLIRYLDRFDLSTLHFESVPVKD
jgi:hypothetical protein